VDALARRPGSDVEPDKGAPAVLRFSHSAVVSAWRQREREMRRRGAAVTLATARRWNEGGTLVPFLGDGDDFVVPVRTWGRHPSLFVFDPRPVWRLLRSRHWDLLDIHEEPNALATAELLVLRGATRGRMPFLLYSAQNIEKRYPPPFRWIERWTLHRAGGVYVCNRAAGEILSAKGLRGELVELPLGVDTDHFGPTAASAPSHPLRVGYVGRLNDHKGVAVLLRAVAQDDAVVVEVVGAGPQAAELAALAKEIGITDRVVFRGFAEQGELPDLYRSFDVLAVPSLPQPGWLEQFCRVAVEAMASGVPVVASDSGALPEVVGPAGLLVPPGDPAALAGALRRIGSETGLWSRLRGEALQRAPQFAWPAVADGHLSLYRDVLAASARRPSR
jgi:glycosyltransferase involved in cell wall biosynthesis